MTILPELRDELVAAMGRRRRSAAPVLAAVAAVAAVAGGVALAVTSGEEAEREVAIPGTRTVLLPPLDDEARRRHGGAYEVRRVRTPGGYTGFVSTGNGRTCTWGALGERCEREGRVIATTIGCVLPDRTVVAGIVPPGHTRVGLVHRDGRPGRTHQVRDGVFRFTVPKGTRPSAIDVYEPGDVDRWPVVSADACAPRMVRCPPAAWRRGGGEDWAVRGVSCGFVGRFVFHEFEPHPGPYVWQAAGFACRVRQPGGEYAALRATCTDGGRAFRFVFS